MALSVNINVPSLNAQRQLSNTSKGLNTTLERLSSGLRINRAADDAAGLAISNGLTAQTRGLNQAVRNAGDGLSLLGSAESAISSQTDIIQRLRELAVQSASDTNSSTNRASINSEATDLKNEFDRIARSADFNGVKLLDGSFTGRELQVGANSSANDRLTVGLSSTRSADIGSAYLLTSASAVAGSLLSGELTITANGVTTSVGAAAADGVSFASASGSALAYATAVNAVSSDTGVTASSTNVQTAGAVQDETNDAGNGAGVLLAGDFLLNGVDIGAVTLTAGHTEIRDAINAVTNQTGVTAAVVANKLVLTAADGRNITVDQSATAGVDDTTGITDGTYRGQVTLRSAGAFTISNATSEFDFASNAGVKDTSKNISSIDLTTKLGSQQAIDILDTALSELNTKRSSIGAQTNRLNSTIANLSAASENSAAANSRVLDADFASETAALTRSQILQQAGVAVLSQANQFPQIALSLLK